MEGSCMRAENLVVEAMSTKDVNTKFGSKKTYSFKAGGEWYKTGFKAPSFGEGDCISFDYKPGTYGNEVDLGTVTKGGAPSPKTAGVGAGSSGSGASRHGSFPIGPLDGQRSILRQNALTNARELVMSCCGGPSKDVDTWVKQQARMSLLASEVVRLAKEFEAYTSGDMDMEMATAAVDAEMKKAA
jgi:hypothetical protein